MHAHSVRRSTPFSPCGEYEDMKLEALQNVLYRAAKEDKQTRFYSLHAVWDTIAVVFPY